MQVNQEKLREWLNSLPEIAREKEPANVLALVFFVEVLKEREGKKESVNGNAQYGKTSIESELSTTITS